MKNCLYFIAKQLNLVLGSRFLIWSGQSFFIQCKSHPPFWSCGDRRRRLNICVCACQAGRQRKMGKNFQLSAFIINSVREKRITYALLILILYFSFSFLIYPDDITSKPMARPMNEQWTTKKKYKIAEKISGLWVQQQQQQQQLLLPLF